MAYLNRVCGGCYFYVAPAGSDTYPRHIKHALPLVDSEVHSTILSTTSRTVLKQNFTNPSSTDAIKECIYTFPLYDGVSVVSFTCHIGNKIIRGLVKEKKKARATYGEAVSRGETAGLFEQDRQMSDVFSTKLGNIPAGESVIVEIVYVGELKHDAEANGIRFTVPTIIAPRYGNDHMAIFHPSNLPVRTDGGMKITVDVSLPSGSFIQGIQSPSHPLSVSLGTLSTAPQSNPSSNKASATLSLGTTALEKDFVLIVLYQGLDTPRAILETHPTITNHRALMTTLVPKFSLPASRPEIVFIADRSRSMNKNIPMLISAMKVFLKSMPPGIKFNICSFGKGHHFLWEKSKSYDAETLKNAMAYVEGFSADMGGTETYDAVRATIERRYGDIPLEVVLLTDGNITSQIQLLTYVKEEVAKSSGNIRIFPLGIGHRVSHAFIEGLARAGNGFAQNVQSGERFDGRVVRMLRGALSPHITDYTLEVSYGKNDAGVELVEKVTDGMRVCPSNSDETGTTAPQATVSLFDPAADPEKEDLKALKDDLPVISIPKVLQAPYEIPSLFPFSRSVVYLLLSPSTFQRTPQSVILKGTSSQGPLELSIPVEVLSTPAETIHQLAAKKSMQDLEEGRGWIYDASAGGISIKNKFQSRFEDIAEKEAVRLGEQFQIAGKWTSFVAVTKNDDEIAAKEKQKKSTLDEWEVLDDEAAFDHPQSFYQNYESVHEHRRVRAMMVRATGTDTRSDTRSTGAFSTQLAAYGKPGPFPGPLLASLSSQGYPRNTRATRPVKVSGNPFGGMSQGRSGSSNGHFISGVPEPYDAASRLTSSSRILGYERLGSISGGGSPASPSSSFHASHAPFVVPESIPDKVLALLERQSFEGSWDAGDEKVLCEIMELGEAIGGGAPEVKNKVLTMLVVLWLEGKAPEEEGVWGLVVEKARSWLVQSMGGEGRVAELEKSVEASAKL